MLGYPRGAGWCVCGQPARSMFKGDCMLHALPVFGALSTFPCYYLDSRLDVTLRTVLTVLLLSALLTEWGCMAIWEQVSKLFLNSELIYHQTISHGLPCCILAPAKTWMAKNLPQKQVSVGLLGSCLLGGGLGRVLPLRFLSSHPIIIWGLTCFSVDYPILVLADSLCPG